MKHKTEQQKNYLLVIPGTNEVVFQGSYTKYYAGIPYIAVFENYPAASTRIWLCKATPKDPNTDKRIRLLTLRKPYGEVKQIGNYIMLCEMQTEAEANDKIESFCGGDKIFRQVLGGDKS